MLIGAGKPSDKSVATVYDNKNHVGLYSCDVESQQMSCSQVGSSQYNSRITIKPTEEAKLSFVMEGGPQGQEMKPILEVNYQKQ